MSKTAEKNNIKPDTILKTFWRDNDHFADLFNAALFDGEQVLNPADLMEVDTDVLYQWRDLVPTYKDSVTTIRDLYMDSVCVNRAEVILDLKGDERLPINNVSVKNIYVKELTDSVKYVKNARNIILEGLKYNN